jgi:hypothetical protein
MPHPTLFAMPLAALLGAVGIWSVNAGSVPSPALGAHEQTSSPLPAAEIANASHAIDQLVKADLDRHNLKAAPPAGDEAFLRRAYLDIVGRIPSLAEITACSADRSSRKRQELVRTLLASEGHVSRQFDWFADLLRAQTRLSDRYAGQAYLDWMKQAIREDKPYDKMVSEMLRAEGPALEPGNGATGYYLRDAGMPLDNMANTVRVFLGTQLTCAQCHNHPNDKWTRQDFFAMAAFTSGTSVQAKLNLGKGNMQELRKLEKDGTPELKNIVRQLSQTLGLKVQNNDQTSIKLPADYQYPDAKPGAAIRPHVMFGAALPVPTKGDPRDVYAAWMTAPENARFTLVIANRMWKEAMGIGLIEPVDHLMDDTVASNPELMDYLTRLMVGVKYDLRKFQEILFTTETYQRVATKEEPAAGEPWRYQSAVLHRMTAEQTWDSLLTLVVPDLDQQKGADAQAMIAFFQDNKDKSAEDVMAIVKDIASSRGKGKELQQQFQDLRAQVDKARADKAAPDVMRQLQEKMRALGEQRRGMEMESDPYKKFIKSIPRKKVPEGKGVGPLLRASELPSPAPGNHLLRTFGQSDRELIDNGTDSPAVTQALSLLNGFVDSDVLGKGSLLAEAVAKATSAEEKARVLFLTILTRQPTAHELAVTSTEIGASKDGWTNIAWCLLNSHEFIFVQ